MGDASAIRAAGWRQGSVFLAAEASRDLREILSPAIDQFTHWIVLSQDCDLVHHSFTAEPHVELLGCNLVTEINGNFTSGKNPRRIQLPITATGLGNVSIEAAVCDRFTIERRVLSSAFPSSIYRVCGGALDTLVDWVARRYTRSAFPDSFNRRLAPKHRGFKKLLEERGSVLSGVWFGLSTFDELPDSASYSVAVRLVMAPEDYENAGKLDEALIASGAMECALNACEGIVVTNISVVSEHDFSLAETKIYTPWDGFDYLSNSEAPLEAAAEGVTAGPH